MVRGKGHGVEIVGRWRMMEGNEGDVTSDQSDEAVVLYLLGRA